MLFYATSLFIGLAGGFDAKAEDDIENTHHVYCS